HPFGHLPEQRQGECDDPQKQRQRRRRGQVDVRAEQVLRLGFHVGDDILVRLAPEPPVRHAPLSHYRVTSTRSASSWPPLSRTTNSIGKVRSGPNGPMVSDSTRSTCSSRCNARSTS